MREALVHSHNVRHFDIVTARGTWTVLTALNVYLHASEP
jgi:hypothetical protein